MRVQHCLSIDAAILNKDCGVSLDPVRKTIRPARNERKNGMEGDQPAGRYNRSKEWSCTAHPAARYRADKDMRSLNTAACVQVRARSMTVCFSLFGLGLIDQH